MREPREIEECLRIAGTAGKPRRSTDSRQLHVSYKRTVSCDHLYRRVCVRQKVGQEEIANGRHLGESVFGFGN